MKMDLRTPINFDFDQFLNYCNSNLNNASLTHDEPISAVLTGKEMQFPLCWAVFDLTMENQNLKRLVLQ